MTQGKHLVVPVSERDHRQGPATAAVTLVRVAGLELTKAYRLPEAGLVANVAAHVNDNGLLLSTQVG